MQQYRQHGIYLNHTLAEILDHGAERWNNRPALVYQDEVVTYGELRRRVNRLAAGLADLGCRAGDRLVLQLPNIPEFVYTYFACQRIGAIPVLALPPHREAEIRFFLEHTGARYYVVPDTLRGFDYTELAARLQDQVSTLEQVLVAGNPVRPGHVSLAELMAAGGAGEPDRDWRSCRPDPDEVALFLLSGGTTGLPKLIPRTHNDYWYNSLASGQLYSFGEQTVFLAVVPVAHNFSLACPGIQAVWQYGGTVVLSPGVDGETVFRHIERHRVTFVSAVPATAIQWLNDPARHRYDLSSWQTLLTGGQKFNPEPAALVKERLGCELQQVFGMAEGLLVYTRPGDDEYTRYHTCGRPLSPQDEVLVTDDNGNPVPAGAVGELWTRGPYTIAGYYQADAHNAVAFSPDGYYKTGDMVCIDAGNRLIVCGRKKDLINRGGEKISAEEIENLLLAHPQVEIAAVVAMPDPVLGERACACLVLRSPGLNLEEIKAHLLARGIAKFKLPERLEILDTMPLTNVGKIDKNALRARVVARLAGGSNEEEP